MNVFIYEYVNEFGKCIRVVRVDRIMRDIDPNSSDDINKEYFEKWTANSIMQKTMSIDGQVVHVIDANELDMLIGSMILENKGEWNHFGSLYKNSTSYATLKKRLNDPTTLQEITTGSNLNPKLSWLDSLDDNPSSSKDTKKEDNVRSLLKRNQKLKIDIQQLEEKNRTLQEKLDSSSKEFQSQLDMEIKRNQDIELRLHQEKKRTGIIAARLNDERDKTKLLQKKFDCCLKDLDASNRQRMINGKELSEHYRRIVQLEKERMRLINKTRQNYTQHSRNFRQPYI